MRTIGVCTIPNAVYKAATSCRPPLISVPIPAGPKAALIISENLAVTARGLKEAVLAGRLICHERNERRQRRNPLASAESPKGLAKTPAALPARLLPPPNLR